MDAFSTIREAVNAVSDGGTIFIADGTYNIVDASISAVTGQYILVDKTITFQGSGAGTIIKSGVSGGQGFFINAPNVQFKDLKFTEFCYGGPPTTGHGTGIYVGHTTSDKPAGYFMYEGSGLLVENVIFDTMGYGVVYRGVYADGAHDPVGAPNWTGVDNVGTSTGVTIRNCTFININYKATYFEKGNNVTIEGCSFTDVGLTYKTGAAIDYNVKNGTYSNLVIRNNTFDNCGNPAQPTLSATVWIKARGTGGDAANYVAYPATLDGALISGNIFANSNTWDLMIGENGRDVDIPANTVVTGNTFTGKITNVCGPDQTLYLVRGANSGLDDPANAIAGPGPIIFLRIAIPQTGEPISYTWLYALLGIVIALGIGITLKKTAFSKR